MYDEIAEYYDTLYAGKDYESECQFLYRAFRRYRRSVRRILDLGCGTGTHAGILGERLTQFGSDMLVTGVDRSARMLAIARSKFPHLDFRLGDIATFRSDERYDVAVALFDVLGHVRGHQLEQVFRTANHHLNAKGLFIFDVWNRTAVMRGQRPRGRLDACGSWNEQSPCLFKYVEMWYSAIADSGLVEYVIIDLAAHKVVRHAYEVTLFTRARVRDLCRLTGFELSSYARHCTLDQKPLSKDWRVSVVLRNVAH